jgi:hypothetical protein
MHSLVARQIFSDETGVLTSELFTLRGWHAFTIAFPVLDIGFTAADQVRIRIRMLCGEYNDEPASIELLNPKGEYVAAVEQDPGGVFNSSAHPVTGRPFICMRGSREYHVHPSHINDRWETIRDQFTLGYVLTQVWRAWKRRNP